MESRNKCNESYTLPSYIIQIDLLELESRFIDELLRDTKELYDSMRTFEKHCVGTMTRSVYDFTMSMFHLALLKMSTAIENKLKNSQIADDFIDFILKYYTTDEKNSLRELERFSKLDPNVTPPEVLADIIVAEEGEVYKLVRDAVAREYVDFARILKTWESELRIRNHLTRAFITVYQARFQNIIKAFELLLTQQPAWLKRFFKEYETALLASAEVRANFEAEFNRIFGKEVSELENALRALENENNILRKKLEEVSVKLALTEEDTKRREEELTKIRAEYESLRNRYESVLADFNKRMIELESLRKELLEKEHELERLRDSEASGSAAKVALENEIKQLRLTILEYERKLQEYRDLENRVKELENAFGGKSSGSVVKKEEINYYYEVVAGRARRILEDRRVNVFDPRTSAYILIDNWSKIEKYYTSVVDGTTNLHVAGIVFTKLVGVFSKKKDVVLEYALLSHLSMSDAREFDAQPVNISEFTRMWRERTLEAEEEKYYHVIIVFSPTGFSEELIKYITGQVPWAGVASKYTTVYLNDLIRGHIYYNVNDPIAKNNAFLANLELPEEQVEKIINYLMSEEARLDAIKRSPTVKFLSLSDISRHTGISDRGIIRRALSILEGRGVGQVRIVNDEIVFAYKGV